MKKGFTMIELIFVIVILGVLASVAIPRLAATRDDAEVSKAATNLATAISDITAYYTAQGEFQTDGSFDKMTSAVTKNGELKVKGDKVCTTIKLEGGNVNNQQTSNAAKIKFTITGSNDPVCKQLQKLSGIKSMCGQDNDLTDNTECAIQVGGSGVKF